MIIPSGQTLALYRSMLLEFHNGVEGTSEASGQTSWSLLPYESPSYQQNSNMSLTKKKALIHRFSNSISEIKNFKKTKVLFLENKYNDSKSTTAKS